MYTKNRKRFKKIVICLTYAMLLLQAQGMEDDTNRIGDALRINKLMQEEFSQKLNDLRNIVCDPKEKVYIIHMNEQKKIMKECLNSLASEREKLIQRKESIQKREKFHKEQRQIMAGKYEYKLKINQITGGGLDERNF